MREPSPGRSLLSLGFFLQIPQGGVAAIEATAAAVVMGSAVTFAEQGQSPGVWCCSLLSAFIAEDRWGKSSAFQRSM